MIRPIVLYLGSLSAFSIEPSAVVEIPADNLLRHTVYVGLREDKPPDEVRRE